jgi:hypothetical protein
MDIQALAKQPINGQGVQIEKLRRKLNDTAQFLDVMANTLDEWAEQSRSGGWSTHQVEANRSRANECRRQAAHIRSILET